MALEIQPPRQKARILSSRLQRDSRAQPTTLTCGVLIAADLNNYLI